MTSDAPRSSYPFHVEELPPISAMLERRVGNLCLNCLGGTIEGDECPQCGYRGESVRPSFALPAGTILQNRYVAGRILRTASDHFNLCYRAVDSRSGTPMVIREYFPRELARRLEGTPIAGPRSMSEAPSYSYGLKAFVGESRELRALLDPHVIVIRHIFEENGTGYVVEDFCNAPSLADHLQRFTGQMTESDALRLVAPLLDTLDGAHAKQLLHLDVRPENVLIRDAGDPVLIGFAASRIALAERMLSLPTLPSCCYAPIERYLSTREMGPWTDIYSVAAILYRLLTGVDVPVADERSDMDAIATIDALNPAVSRRTSAAIAQALRLNRRNRYGTIADFRRALLPESMTVNGFEPEMPAARPVWVKTGARVFGRFATLGFAFGGLVYLAILLYLGVTSITKALRDPGDHPDSAASGGQFALPAIGEKWQVKPASPPVAGTARSQSTPVPSLGRIEQSAKARKEFQTLLERANTGFPENWLMLAKAYENGEGTPVNITKAIEWYRLCSERNIAEAQTALGRIYATGKAGQRNRVEGLRWYRIAADQGFPDAQFALGALYELGVAVPADMAKALSWYRAAAESGQPMAQNRLGKLYDEGQGVAADDKEAVTWYRRAAEQGDIDAQYNLALMYDNGEGVERDKGEALRWLERSAAGGGASAKALLKKWLADN